MIDTVEQIDPRLDAWKAMGQLDVLVKYLPPNCIGRGLEALERIELYIHYLQGY